MAATTATSATPTAATAATAATTATTATITTVFRTISTGEYVAACATGRGRPGGVHSRSGLVGMLEEFAVAFVAYPGGGGDLGGGGESGSV